jgi:hypothetical protein
VILTIPDTALAELVACPVLLAQMWPGACDEVRILVQVLRLSVPSLAEVLAFGLVSMLTPPRAIPSAQISLVHSSAVLVALAQNEAGECVIAPHLRPADVWRLEITDLAVGGQSGLRLAG